VPPATAINKTGNVLELITVAKDGSLQHSRFISGAWKAPVVLKQTTSLPPALAAGPSGGLELAVVATDGQIYHARFTGTQWSGFQTTGVESTLTPALAVSDDGIVHLVATSTDGSVVHSRFVDNAWEASVPTGIDSNFSPALAFNSSEGALELLAVDTNGAVQHGRYVDGSWSDPVSLEINTEVRPALAAVANGVAAAVVDTDHVVSVGLFQPPPPVSFKTDILRIFTNNGSKTCARSGCHAGSRPANNMSLEASKAYKNIVNVRDLVVPGDPDSSVLFQEVESGRMPRSGGPLTDDDIDLLRRWIEAGAPNN
jgi:hypothetical protein